MDGNTLSYFTSLRTTSYRRGYIYIGFVSVIVRLYVGFCILDVLLIDWIERC